MRGEDLAPVVLMLMLFAFVCGVAAEWRYIKYQAVKHGVAEWRIDEYGNRSIHWKEAE